MWMTPWIQKLGAREGNGLYLWRQQSGVTLSAKKVLIIVLNSTFASSAPSGALKSIQATLGSDQEVSILVVSMYLVGYILGPIVFAPVRPS